VLLNSADQFFLGREIGGKVSVSGLTESKGSLRARHDVPPIGVLIGTEQGLFVAREADGKFAMAKPDGAEVGVVWDIRELPDHTLLIGTDNGLFLARQTGGVVNVTPVVDAKTGSVRQMRDLADGSVLVAARNGLFLARQTGGLLGVAPVGVTDTGAVWRLDPFPGGILIDADRGSFLARETGGGTIKLTPFAAKLDLPRNYVTYGLPSGATLIGTDTGLFLARESGGRISLTPPASAREIGRVREMRAVDGVGVLIAGEKGLFLAQQTGANIGVEAVAGAPPTSPEMLELQSGVVLLNFYRGIFAARADNGKLILTPLADVHIESARSMRALPGVGALITADNGLFVAREVGGKLSIARAGDAKIGPLGMITLLAHGGALVAGNNGIFLVRAAAGGTVSVLPVTDLYTDAYDLRIFPGGDALIAANAGLYRLVSAPLVQARVEIRDRKNLDGSLVEPDRNLSLVITLAHDCAERAADLELGIRVVAPDEKQPGHVIKEFHLTPGVGVAQIEIAPRFDKPGRWSLQLISTAGDAERSVGQVQTLTFVSGPWWERWWQAMVAGFGVALALVNLVLFGLARRFPWAWRLAMDDGWGTWVLRVATLALSHAPVAQLWILDLYFQRVRARVKAPRLFLPLPLTATDGTIRASTDAVAPPWQKRMWVQGGSGMGKTALFHDSTEAHFRDHASAFAAYARWRCIVVSFAARDFAGSGEDKDDPAWVVDAVSATLSGTGLTFASALLTRILQSGTIGVAIDGLNEVDRAKAVDAFARSFSEAPMLVTSQQHGSELFAAWRLPPDIRNFTLDLLRLHLPAQQAHAVMERISASGLKDAIRSGYDVRLVIDLARTDPDGARLPADRMGLYAEVIKAGWPEAPDDVRQEQQSLTAAAAWRMVSERKPNEDMRRLKPDVDLPADLLAALADAPRSDNRPVRLVRRVGAGAFEFVHDQMHAYLAARWFAQDGLSPVELEKMVAGSTIWMQAPDARRVLWGFAAALLDDKRLVDLWTRVEDKEEWDVLRRALKAEAERRGLNPRS
jgi:hypothetical protein